MRHQSTSLTNQNWSWLIENHCIARFFPIVAFVQCATVIAELCVTYYWYKLMPLLCCLVFQTKKWPNNSLNVGTLIDLDCSSASQWFDPFLGESQWHNDVFLQLVCAELDLRSGFLERPRAWPAFLPSPNTRDTTSSLDMPPLLDSTPITTVIFMESADTVLH